MKIHSVEVITPVLDGACSGISSRKSLVLKAVLGDRDIHSITLMMIMLWGKYTNVITINDDFVDVDDANGDESNARFERRRLNIECRPSTDRPSFCKITADNNLPDIDIYDDDEEEPLMTQWPWQQPLFVSICDNFRQS